MTSLGVFVNLGGLIANGHHPTPAEGTRRYDVGFR